MDTHYTPAWKDQKGNRIIFIASNTLFDNEIAAREWQQAHCLDMLIAAFLSPDGLWGMDGANGKFCFPHITIEVPKLGRAAIIDGPQGPHLEEIQP